MKCNSYKKLLNERNALLKRLYLKIMISCELVKDYCLQIVDCAKNIIFERDNFIQKVNKKIKQYHLQISENKEILEIKYAPSYLVRNF